MLDFPTLEFTRISRALGLRYNFNTFYNDVCSPSLNAVQPTSELFLFNPFVDLCDKARYRVSWFWCNVMTH